MTIQRREFLKVGAVTTGALLTDAGRALAAKKSGRRVPIGFQLYSLRGEFAKDVPNTLKNVAEIGYAGVEFWGYNGTPAVYKEWTAKQLRKLLDDNGIKCCGMHMSVKALQDENFQRTVELNKVLGNKLMNVAAASREMKTPDSIKKFAQFMSDRAAKAAPLGMVVGYHCHPFDMVRFGDKSGWEIFFSTVSPKVAMQLDMGNCARGGGDPIAILKEFPHRAHSVHIKEFDDAVWVPGNPKWLEIFKLCETTQPIEWYIVEQGGSGGNGFEIPRECLQKLKKMHK